VWGGGGGARRGSGRRSKHLNFWWSGTKKQQCKRGAAASEGYGLRPPDRPPYLISPDAQVLKLRLVLGAVDLVKDLHEAAVVPANARGNTC
jgi:hypothetical protein